MSISDFFLLIFFSLKAECSYYSYSPSTKTCWERLDFFINNNFLENTAQHQQHTDERGFQWRVVDDGGEEFGVRCLYMWLPSGDGELGERPHLFLFSIRVLHSLYLSHLLTP